MKQAIVLAILVVAAVCLGGCNAVPVRVGAVVRQSDAVSYLALKKGLEEAKGSGVISDLEYRVVGEDEMALEQMVTRQLQHGMNALLVTPVDINAIHFSINQAQAAFVPILFMGRRVPEENQLRAYSKAYYMGWREDDAGVLMAQALVKALGESSAADSSRVVLCIRGSLNNPVDDLRYQGFVNEFKKTHPQVGIQEVHVKTWLRIDAERSVTALLEKLPNIAGLVATTDDLAVGGAEALHNLGRQGVPVIGIGGMIGRQAVENGLLTVCVDKNRAEEAALILDVVQSLARDSRPPKKVVVTDRGGTVDKEGRYIWGTYRLIDKTVLLAEKAKSENKEKKS